VSCNKHEGPVREAVSHKDDYEQAYFYAFPMIAAYKAMYQFSIDKSNSQYKAPLNTTWNDSKTFTPKDTAIVTPNADTPVELDASKHNYTLTFAKGELPPVNAFWSVTMYDGKTQLLIENPINRYLINSPMLPGLKKNPDGSLTLYIQKDAPSADKKANWLPAPNGQIYMVMRLYWPKEPPKPSILPPGDGTWKPPAIMVAQ
jgi:hypothetical protein